VIFGQDRNELRRMYIDAWRKSATGAVLSPLEAQIASVIEDHPEYQQMMNEEVLDEAFLPEGGETNPFLHMGLHLGIREQVATDRPHGIAAVFQQLAASTGDRHAAEHRMIDCLAETLWEAQRQNAAPDEDKYLESLRHLIA